MTSLQQQHQAALSSLQQHLAESQRELAVLQASFEERVAGLRRDMDERVERQRILIQQQFRDTIAELEDQLLRQQQAAAASTERLLAELEQLRQQYDALERAFRERPARSEDKQEIARLNEEISHFNLKMETA
jgi:hypothetical protein